MFLDTAKQRFARQTVQVHPPQDHFDLGPCGFDAAQDFQPVQTRQAVIQQDNFRRLGIDQPSRFLTEVFNGYRMAVSPW